MLLEENKELAEELSAKILAHYTNSPQKDVIEPIDVGDMFDEE